MNTETPESYETDVEEPVKAHPITWTIIIGSILSMIFLFGYFWLGAANDEPVKAPEYTYVDPNTYRGEQGPTGTTGEAYEELGDTGLYYSEEDLAELDEYDREYLKACYAAAPYDFSEPERAEYNASCLRGVGID